MSQVSQNYCFKIENENIIDNFLNSPPKLIKKKLDMLDAQYQITKRYFQNIKNNNFTIDDKYSNKDCGRMMGIKTTIQSISNNLRSELFKNTAYDIDMKNASFSIAKYIIKTYFKEQETNFTTLLDYSNNREKYYKYKFDKLSFISCLFSPSPKTFIKKNIYDNNFNSLIQEIHNFQKLVIENKDIFNINFKDDASDGSMLSYIIYNIEGQILQKVINEFKSIIIAPVFDGLIFSKDCDLDNVLKRCNEISSSYEVEFINKPFPICKLNLDSPPLYDEYQNNYKLMKDEFEKDHFIVEDPLIYIKEYESSQGEIKMIYYNKGDFKDNTAIYNYEDKEGKDVPFFNAWLKDSQRRSYKTIIWIPSIDEKYNFSDNYNTFKGFSSKLVDIPDDRLNTINDDYDGKSVLTFLQHLSLLVNYEKEGVEYLKNYIADMFQNPTILPEIALLFKSKQGVGKDLMTSILGLIIGETLIHKDAKMENIVGNFNDDLQNKLIIQLNEVCGSDGNFNREILKDLITTEKFNINPKYGKKLKCNNYTRIFAASNNKTPLNIPQDDRRYVVFKCGDPKKKRVLRKSRFN